MDSTKATEVCVTTPAGVLVYLIERAENPETARPLVCSQVQDLGDKLLLGRPFVDKARRFYQLFAGLAEESFDIGIILNGHPELQKRGMRHVRYGDCTYVGPQLFYTQNAVLLDQVTIYYRGLVSWLDPLTPKAGELLL